MDPGNYYTRPAPGRPLLPPVEHGGSYYTNTERFVDNNYNYLRWEYVQSRQDLEFLDKVADTLQKSIYGLDEEDPIVFCKKAHFKDVINSTNKIALEVQESENRFLDAGYDPEWIWETRVKRPRE